MRDSTYALCLTEGHALEAQLSVYFLSTFRETNVEWRLVLAGRRGPGSLASGETARWTVQCAVLAIHANAGSEGDAEK